MGLNKFTISELTTLKHSNFCDPEQCWEYTREIRRKILPPPSQIPWDWFSIREKALELLDIQLATFMT